MSTFKSILTFGLLSMAQVSALSPSRPVKTPATLARPGCGEVDIIFAGFPPSHPLVVEQGFDPAVVEVSIRKDVAEIQAAGYNIRGRLLSQNHCWTTTIANLSTVVLMGAEQSVDTLAQQMRGIRWDGTGVGYGVRGARIPDLTVRLEDIVSFYPKAAPQAPILFNYSPDSALWAIQRKFPLAENCTDSPGKDLGFEIFCDVCATEVSMPGGFLHSFIFYRASFVEHGPTKVL